MVKMRLNLTDDQAIALAQMIKRMSHSDFFQLSTDPSELEAMMTACYKITDELRYHAIDPR